MGEQQNFVPSGPRFSGRKPSALPTRERLGAAPRKNWIWTAAAVTIAALAAALIFSWNRPYAVPTVEAVTQLTDDGKPKPNWSNLETDGSRVYFNEGTNGNLEIAEVSTNGGATAVVLTPSSNQRIRDLSPNGSALLTISGRYEELLYSDCIHCGNSRCRRENRTNSLGSRLRMEASRRTAACSSLKAEVSTSRKEMVQILAK